MALGWLKAIAGHFAPVVIPQSVDASGNVVTGPDGNPAVNIVIGVDALSATTQKSLIGGEHQTMAVTAGERYEINSDIDLYIKTSNGAADYGFIGNTDAVGAEVVRTAGSLATMTGLEFGTSDFAFEAWLKVDGISVNGTGTVFLAGVQGTTLMPYLDIRITKNPTTDNVLVGLLVYSDSASTTPLINTSVELTTVPIGEILHVVINFDRQGAGNDFVATIFTNGVANTTLTGSGTDDAGSLSMSNATASNAKLQLMTQWNNTPSYVGDVYNIRFYTAPLTVAQVAARNEAGPSARANDAGDVNLTWECNFQNFATWADPDQVECTSGFGNVVFDDPKTLLGSISDYIITRAGGESALPVDSVKVWAGTPKLVKIPTGHTYLNLYSKPGAAGDVNLTKVV